MQNVAQGSSSDSQKLEKENAIQDTGKSTPLSSNSSPKKSGTDTFTKIQTKLMTDSSESEEDDVSEVESFTIDGELDIDTRLDHAKFLLSNSCAEETDNSVDPETQARLEALLEAAGIGKLATGDGKHLADPEVLRRLTSSVSCALDEAAAALTRMRTENPRPQVETRSLVEACTDGDVGTVRKLLTEGRSVHETTEEGESLLSLACSAGYLELAQVLLAMHANVEDRGVKGDCTPLMEAASAGHADIVRLLINHGAEVNAQSSSGNTPLMYACAGGHEDVVKVLLEHCANVEDHNENGHTPLMEAASAGHVGVAKILLRHGAGINTHSNEFKESALTLACYKGHLDMVRFLLEEGADQEHKTDEMHTALMEASMDGHVEVARLLLDSGAQVNMPTDSFESPLTLAACGGHTELAMLLIERGANIEEVNDEGYTPLMEAAREGHEEMVALLLSQGANINAQTEETQETALTLACCGGFLEVADFLLKAGADLELGASTPLMEAAQEGHLELCRYLLEYYNANVNAQTQTGDTALTYACENGHTEVATLLLMYGADLEHESEGGRTPLMKACRAGHQYTVNFLISKNADVNKQTTNNDHTPLSLAAAGGHIGVVETLLANRADPFHRLKDNSTMLIEAAKGGHTSVVHLLLDYPHSIMMQPPHPQSSATTTIQDVTEEEAAAAVTTSTTTQTVKSGAPAGPAATTTHGKVEHTANKNHSNDKSMPMFRKIRLPGRQDSGLTTAEAQQVRTQPVVDPFSDTIGDYNMLEKAQLVAAEDAILNKIPFERMTPTAAEQKAYQLQLQQQQQQQTEVQTSSQLNQVPFNIDLATQPQNYIISGGKFVPLTYPGPTLPPQPTTPPLPPQQPFEVSQNTAICDRPKAKPVSKKEGKTLRKLFNLQQHQFELQQLTKEYEQLQLESLQQQQQQQQPTDPSQQQQQQPTLLQQLQEGRGGLTATQILAHLQTLDPTPPTESTTPTQLQLIQQKHQQLWKLHRQLLPNTNLDPPTLAALIPEGQRCQLFSNTTDSVDGDKSTTTTATGAPTDAESLFITAAQEIDCDSKPTAEQIDSLLDFAHKLEAFSLDDAQGDQERLYFQARRKLTAEEFAATEEEAFNLFKQQQQQSQQQSKQQTSTTQDLAYITVPALTSQQLERPENQSLHIQYHQYAVPQTLEVPTGIQITTPLQIPGGGPPITVTRTNKGLQITGATAVMADAYYRGYIDAAIDAANEAASTLQLGTNTAIPAINTYTNAGIPTSQGVQVTSGLPPIQITANSSGQLLASNRIQDAGQPFQSQLLLPSSPLSLPSCSLSTTDTSPTTTSGEPDSVNTTATTSGTAPTTTATTATVTTPPVPPPAAAAAAASVARSTQHAAQICNQVQVATQTVTEKKVTQPTYAPSKGKKARYQLPRQPNTNFTTQSAYTIDPHAGQYAASGNTFQQAHCQTQQQQTQQQQQQQQQQQSQQTQQQPQQQPQPHPPLQISSCMDVDSETDSNHDTALTLACAGGHEELVELLLSRGADIEHRDKKGFTPLILAATAGHDKVVDILLNHGADIEAQSERTKDTPLSLACSGGRYEVVELLLTKMANKEHRNVSDYTPLSLAASGGYVNIIKLLLSHGAEINSRTGSKLGISPLMLAAMNGHTAAVRLLLDMGSDINAQIETNRNTALTLACFQGRHEVVSLLLDRKANVEHRAKTGLTPLMEAASGGYVDVGKVLLDKGADVNAPPVPSSRDTALTIAADKGHYRFVELLLSRGALVEVKNKKGNSPLWLAANGGHLNVVEALYNLEADIDSQDNRKVSCLMAAFRKGHVKVVKWMVSHVTQFPSDQEMTRFVATVNDKELLEKCQECVKVIRAAKDLQSAKANKNATILLEELDMEKNREESKKAAAARRRERKKKKKMEKKEEKRKFFEETKRNDSDGEGEGEGDGEEKSDQDEEIADKLCGTGSGSSGGGGAVSGDNKSEDVRLSSSSPVRNGDQGLDKEEGDSGIDANSQGSCSSNDVKAKDKRKEKKKKKGEKEKGSNSNSSTSNNSNNNLNKTTNTTTTTSVAVTASAANNATITGITGSNVIIEPQQSLHENVHSNKFSTGADNRRSKEDNTNNEHKNNTRIYNNQQQSDKKQKPHQMVFESSRHPADREDFEATGNENYVPTNKGKKSNNYMYHYENEVVSSSAKSQTSSTSPKGINKREEGWKEVVRNLSYRSKKVPVPLNAISRVIGRGGGNINAIRSATGAHIEVEKQGKGQGERIITIKGSTDAIKQAHSLIEVLIKDPEADILQMLPKSPKSTAVAATASSKTKPATHKVNVPSSSSGSLMFNVAASKQVATGAGVAPTAAATAAVASSRTSTNITKTMQSNLSSSSQSSWSTATAPPPRLAASSGDKRPSVTGTSTKTTMSYTSAIMTYARNAKYMPAAATQSFAAKLTDSSVVVSSNTSKPRGNVLLGPPQAPATAPVSPQVSPPQPVSSSPKHHRPQQTASAPPNMQGQFPGKVPFQQPIPSAAIQPAAMSGRSSTPIQNELLNNIHAPSEYSLFNEPFPKATMWGREHENNNHKLNFASVAATGAPPPPSSSTSNNKFIDDVTTQSHQVDITKAPGYRGAAVCSPVSSKSSITPPTIQAIMSGYNNVEQTIRPIDIINSNMGGMSASQHIDVSSLNQSVMGPPGPIGPPPFSTRTSYHNMGRDTQMYNQDLLKINSDNSNQAPMMIPFHQLNSPSQQQQQVPPPPPPQQQQPTPNVVQTNPNVSMSRLNPRAPDFSVSYVNKPTQQTMYHQQQQPQHIAPQGYNRQQGTPNGQNRWSYGQDVVSGYTGHNILQSVDLLSPFENGTGGTSPTMSPSSPTGPPQNHKLEDRKIPRPIGTERNWKNNPIHNIGYNLNDIEQNAWLLNEQKVNWQAAAGMNPVYRTNPTPYRMPLPNDIPQLLDSTYAPSMADIPFHNGASVLATAQLMMANQHPGVPIQVAQYDPTKLDEEGWGDPTRLGLNDVNDKTHGWTKWSH